MSQSSGDEMRKPASVPSGTRTTGFVSRILDVIGPVLWCSSDLRNGLHERLTEAQCFFELHDAMGMYFATEWNREPVEGLLQSLSNEPNEKGFLGTYETWRATVAGGEELLRTHWGEGVDVHLRMIRARVTLPIADDDREVDLFDAGETISIADTQQIVSDVAERRSPTHRRWREPEENGQFVTDRDSPAVFLSFQIHLAREAGSVTSTAEKAMEKVLPTAQIWLVYDVVKNPQPNSSEQRGLVQNVDVYRCQLTHESGVWRAAVEASKQIPDDRQVPKK